MPNFNFKHSEKTKKQMSESHKGDKNFNFGKKMSEEQKQKISKGHIGKKASLETRKKLSKLRIGNKYSLGHKHTEETKKQMSEAHKGDKNSMWNPNLKRERNCKTCGKIFYKRFNVSNNTWNKTTFYCSVKCAAEERAKNSSGEKHYNWKGGLTHKQYYEKNPELYKNILERNKQVNKQKRLTVLRFYSNSEIPFCNCCKENIYEFLAIDHSNNDGSKHRKEIGNKIVNWLIQNNFPIGFQILCHNCNQAKGLYGKCPHKK